MAEMTLSIAQAVDSFLSSNQFEELRKFKLGDEEWRALEVFKKILDVSFLVFEWSLHLTSLDCDAGAPRLSTEIVCRENPHPLQCAAGVRSDDQQVATDATGQSRDRRNYSERPGQTWVLSRSPRARSGIYPGNELVHFTFLSSSAVSNLS